MGAATTALANAPAWIANISVLTIFGGVIAAGIMRGLKEVRDFQKPAAAPSASVDAQVAAVTILENATLSAWTKSNTEVAVAITHLCDTLRRHTEVLDQHHDETANLRRVVEDVAHALRRGLP